MGNLTGTCILEDIQTSVAQYVITKIKWNGEFQCYNIREAQQLCQMSSCTLSNGIVQLQVQPVPVMGLACDAGTHKNYSTHLNRTKASSTMFWISKDSAKSESCLSCEKEVN